MAILDYNSAIDDAKESGYALGAKDDEKRLIHLIRSLQADHRDADIDRVYDDDAFREKMYREYHI